MTSAPSHPHEPLTRLLSADRGSHSHPWRVVQPSAWSLATLTLAVALIYSALIRTESYAFTDDYFFLVAANGSLTDLLGSIIGAGRPMAAAFDAVAFTFVESIAGLRWLRVISVLGLALLAAFTFLLLRWLQMPLVPAWCTSLIIVSLPCFQVVAAWSILFFVPYVAVTAGAAALLTQRIVDRAPGALLSSWRPLIWPTLLMLLCLTAYQPVAMWYWVVVAAVVLSPRVTHLRRSFGVHLVVVAMASMASLIVLRLGVAYTEATGDRTTLATDAASKVLWFVREPLRRAFDPLAAPSPVPDYDRSVVVGVTVAFLVLLHLYQLRRLRLGSALLCCLLPLAVLPNLVSSEDWASARTLVALMPLAALAGAWGVTGAVQGLVRRLHMDSSVARDLPIALTAAAFASQAQHVVTQYYVVPQVREAAIVTQALRDATAEGDFPVIYLRRSTWKESLAPATSYDEFGIPSTFPAFAVAPMARAIIAEHDIPFDGDFEVLPDGAVLPTNAPIIDFAYLLRNAQYGNAAS